MSLVLKNNEHFTKQIAGTSIEGVDLKKLQKNIDPRGSFTEIFQDYWQTCIQPTQWSFVESSAQVFRGMHLHLRHDEYFCLLKGTCLLGLYDLRPTSPTYNTSTLYWLSGEDLAALTFPKGIIHGWLFLEESLHVQAVSEAYRDYNKDDNLGCYWADPALSIPWGVDEKEINLSEKASSFPSLQQL
ncbi:MAG: dTDP-4-dehydrorhamnose 3,5-epimerase family protein, partial [Bacteroidota bacterium]